MCAWGQITGMSAAEQLSVTREHPPCPETRLERVMYVRDLMTRGLWVRGETAPEIAADWGVTTNCIERYAAEASHSIKLLESKDHVIGLIRDHAERWIRESGPDRVSSAKLLAETHGAITQQHKHSVEISTRSDAELFVMALVEIRNDPVLREKAIRFLSAESADVGLLTTGESIDG